MRGDYGLFQCSEPCCRENFDKEALIREMVKRQENRKIPSGLLPVCRHCGKPMTMNLRADDRFVEDEGWHREAERYGNFLRTRSGGKKLFPEWGRLQHLRHHQIPLPADDGSKPKGCLFLRQSGKSRLLRGDCKPGDLHQRGYRQDPDSAFKKTETEIIIL